MNDCVLSKWIWGWQGDYHHQVSLYVFQLVHPQIATSHAEIWQAVFFSLNRGRCGSVMFDSTRASQRCSRVDCFQAVTSTAILPHMPPGSRSGLNLLFLCSLMGFSEQCVIPCSMWFSQTECIDKQESRRIKWSGGGNPRLDLGSMGSYGVQCVFTKCCRSTDW